MSSVKRFFAQTARDALRKVKEELGGDAIVLSNRSVEGGVEIMAAKPAVLAALRPAPARSPEQREEDFTVSLSTRGRQREEQPPEQSAPDDSARQEAKRWQPFRAKRIAKEHIVAPAAPLRPAARVAPEPVPMPARVDPTPVERSAAVQTPPPQLMEELHAIRDMIERQLAGFAWGDLARRTPFKSALLGELLEVGFSGELARRLVDAVPAEADLPAARNLVRTALSRDLVTIGSDADIIDRGGVYALVGPTGVGKTTTTAKLAARCVVRHGADKLALLTTDGYRIGAHEQLRIYGRILGVTVHAVREAGDLKQTLRELRDKHMVLIDTVGVSQRDRMVAEQAAMLMNAGDVRRLLLLNATCRGDTLDDVVRAYSGPDLVGCVITKVDEAATLAPVLDALVRHELEMFYVANGQRVPEDLHLPNRSYLLHRALRRLPEQSPHRLREDEAALLFAAARPAGASMGAPIA